VRLPRYGPLDIAPHYKSVIEVTVNYLSYLCQESFIAIKFQLSSIKWLINSESKDRILKKKIVIINLI
jgi:hypothetical protein